MQADNSIQAKVKTYADVLKCLVDTYALVKDDEDDLYEAFEGGHVEFKCKKVILLFCSLCALNHAVLQKQILRAAGGVFDRELVGDFPYLKHNQV